MHCYSRGSISALSKCPFHSAARARVSGKRDRRSGNIPGSSCIGGVKEFFWVGDKVCWIGEYCDDRKPKNEKLEYLRSGLGVESMCHGNLPCWTFMSRCLREVVQPSHSQPSSDLLASFAFKFASLFLRLQIQTHPWHFSTWNQQLEKLPIIYISLVSRQKHLFKGLRNAWQVQVLCLESNSRLQQLEVMLHARRALLANKPFHFTVLSWSVNWALG